MEKIICPFHANGQERTPSMVIYASGWAHCYACRAHVRVEQLGIKVDKEQPKREAEDVAPKVAYIRNLPKRAIRGLSLPADEVGYFVLWPDGAYYKYRAYAGKDAGSKYRGPAGVPKPMFVCGGGNVSPLAIIVEGEINALSLAEAFPGVTIYSPGGAGDFYSKRALEKDLPIYLRHEKLLIIADNDAAGAIAAIELRARLEGKGPKLRVKLMEPDANDILAWMGHEALKEEVNEALEM